MGEYAWQDEHLQHELEEDLKRYAERVPMTQLRDEFHVTPTNPKPPLVHFGLPVDLKSILAFAEANNLHQDIYGWPDVSLLTMKGAVLDHMTRYIRYPIYFADPFGPTSDCDIVLGFYNNYSRKWLNEEYEELIEWLRKAFVLDKSVRPKWYFDLFDPWEPPPEDEDEDEEDEEDA